ncbi:MAG TPA: glycosyltransferase [Phycisphaerae bacterium]|nr:glycosyltransferase [Phycisphaerales bacterium]HRX86942.1 glycosyltransferase [Phycisphaerae bacterium]
MVRTTSAVEAGDAAASAGAVTDRLIVCIASCWDIDPTSKHHLMRMLARRNDVVWVNYHASRRPRFNRADLRSALNVLRRIAGGTRPIESRMVQTTPFVLPSGATPFRDAVNRRLLALQLRRIIRARRRSADQPVQIWTFAPDVAFLAGAFGEECLVYYCVDEFSEFEGFDRAATLAAEAALMARADVVMATSERLFAARRDRHPNVHLVRHGVDHAHFAQAVERDLPKPGALRGISGPIAGFFGLIQHWFDAALLADVARRLPDVSFVLVGETVVDVGPLAELPNVHLLGRQPYAELPAYCAAFDVALIPFVRSPMTENVNPIKLREYLAAGVPVVSTALPEVRPYAPDVACVDDAEGFADACRRALATDSIAARRQRSAWVADESWDAVTARVERLVCAAIAAQHAD